MSGEIILYTTEDGGTQVFLREMDGSVWLTQADMAELFQATKQNISLHVRNIFTEGELSAEAVVKEYLTTAADGKSYRTQHYNLLMILAIGFRVRSPRGTQFRRWATASLSEYLVKGFIMDDARLKEPGGDSYFDELLARIRDIRSSEKVFWKKVLEIYATSLDYDPSAEASQAFFATIQNKMHWAAHGHTAAEVIHARADARQDHMGLTNWPGAAKSGKPRKSDAAIAKNYLSPEELDTLNRIVTLYLEFAELQAQQRKAMRMADWITKLDQFLTISDRNILTHAGKISAETARLKAESQYEAWNTRVINEPSPVERHFAEAISAAKRIEAAGKKLARKGKKDAS